jgi:hypothetical protein
MEIPRGAAGELSPANVGLVGGIEASNGARASCPTCGAFHDEDAARAYLEGVRWPDGPLCPFCGSFETVKPVGGSSMVFERSHIPLRKWLAFRLMALSKKASRRTQIHRTLGIN